MGLSQWLSVNANVEKMLFHSPDESFIAAQRLLCDVHEQRSLGKLQSDVTSDKG